MKLSEKLIKQFRNELFNFEKVFFKNIYQIKNVNDGIGGSIMFSCRFRTPDFITYLLSISINIGGDMPHARASIHQLCERRWHSRMIACKRIDIKEENSLKAFVRNENIMGYYKTHKHFPYNLMAATFVGNGFKEFIIETVDILENNHE